MAKRVARFLVEGTSKSGKTHLAAGAAPPRLFIDLEGRAQFTPAGQQATFWNGADDPLKLKQSPSRTYILDTRDIDILGMALQWLRTGKHQFRSIILDSAMELRSQAIYKVVPGIVKPERNQYGEINKITEGILKDIYELPKSASPGPCECVIVLTGAEYSEGINKIVPLGLGSYSQMLPHKMDAVMYLEEKRGRRIWLANNSEGTLCVGDGFGGILVKKFGPTVAVPDGPNQILENFLNEIQKLPVKEESKVG